MLMKKMKFFLVIFLLGSITHVMLAQVKLVTGTVTSEGEPLPGVAVVVKGTDRGTTTDFNGKYEIKASPEDVLLFSFIGMKNKEVKVGDKTHINVEMEESSESLKKVIVTALGIKKQRKSLTYAAQDLKSSELKRVKQTNPINSLSGKIAGLTINRNASGAGGSVKVVLRGNKSLRNNQPLYVVDGVPLANNTSYNPISTFGDKSGGNRDGGDALSLINPDDIESVSVLKGASASALYGSAGLNGVILITTKKGKKGGFSANFSSGFTVDSPAYFMDFYPDAQTNVDNFFQKGSTNINSISLSGGTQAAQTYFSYSNTFASGILPTNDMSQHTINIKETAQLLKSKLRVNAGAMYSKQSIDNRPISAMYYNPLVGVYNYDASQGPLSDWKNYEEFDSSRNLMRQRWFRPTSDIEQNPYWILYRNPTLDNNHKLLLNLGLTYKLTDKISLQTRGSYDNSKMDYTRKVYATSNGTLSHKNGRYINSNFDYTQWYADLTANYNSKLTDDISVQAVLGTSLTHDLNDTFYADSGNTGGLQYANVFAIQNFNASANVNINEHHIQKKVSSIFFSSTLGYKDQWYLDLTARNDWSSALPEANRSYFYPSVGLTGILSNMMKLGDKVSFAKVRASYAEVGNDVPANFLYPNRNIYFGSGVDPEDPVRPLSIPRPEKQKSFEAGTEWRFNNERYGIDIGFYKTNTVDQYFIVAASAAGTSGGRVGVNSGDILNQGWEISAFAYPIKKENIKWRSTLNFATNHNEVINLSNKEEGVEISYYAISPGGVNSYASYLVEGGSYGDIYGQVVKRDENGRPIVDLSGGAVTIQKDDNADITIEGLEKIGNANPDFTLGWNNSFDYKDFTFDFLIDGRFGGVTMSMTEAVVEGMSDNSAREQSGQKVEVIDTSGNLVELDANKYYSAAGGRNGFTGEYVYDATNIRLAEMAISYKFNMNKFGIKRAKVGIIGNNLFFFYKDAPHDPNVTSSIGNALQGVNVFNLPSTRSLGLNLNLTF